MSRLVLSACSEDAVRSTEGTGMQQTLEQLDLAALDFEPALPCDFESCVSGHGRSAEYRLLVGHTGLPDGRHGAAVRLACEPCYEWLIRNPTRIAVCPTHGDLGVLRDWWTLLGVV